MVKAYAVLETFENTGAIYFEEHAVVARRRGANEFADGELSDVTCRRAPWADAYADRPLPVWLMVAHGWRFECTHCGRLIEEDDMRDAGLPLEGIVGTQHSSVFCRTRCARKHHSRERRRKAEQLRAIEHFKGLVLRRFPDARLSGDSPNTHHAYVRAGRAGWQWRHVAVSFRFPGMKIGPANLRFRGDSSRIVGPPALEFACCSGDREAFEVWAKQTRAKP